MKKLFFCCMAIFLFVFSADAAEKTTTLKVISYNMRLSTGKKPDGKPVDGTNAWMFRYPATLEMMTEEKPDVMGVQEMCPDQREMILEYFNGAYKCVGVGRDDGKKKGECMAIWYNPKTVTLLKWGTLWLSETPDKVSKGWDASCCRSATWAILKHKPSGKKFFMINTHLDHRGRVAREKSCELLLEKAQSLNPQGLPYVFTGDFNLEDYTDLILEFSQKVQNARLVAETTDNIKSFNGWGKSYEMIDYIFFNGFSRCVEFKTLTKKYADKPFISDHFPIRALLEF